MISICVHSTNRGKYLSKFLKSLTYQTSKNFEIVIVDNESTDDTQEVIEKYQDKLNIKHIVFRVDDDKITNLNPIAYNLAVEHASSDKLILTVSDVLFEYRNIENAEKLYDKNKVYFGHSLYVYDNSLISNIRKLDIDKYPELLEYKNEQKDKAFFKVHEDYNRQPIIFCALLSKELYQNIGGYDERFVYCVSSSDVDLGHRLKTASKDGAEFTSDLFTVHIPHEKSKTINKELLQKGIRLRKENHAKAAKGEYKVNNSKRKIKIL